jgi:hypothetical protein
MAHMNQLDFVRTQLGENREKMPAIDRKTIARAVFPHYARNEFAAVGFAHQQILLKVTPASSCTWPWTYTLGRNGVTSSERINVNSMNPYTFRPPAETAVHASMAGPGQHPQAQLAACKKRDCAARKT